MWQQDVAVGCGRNCGVVEGVKLIQVRSHELDVKSRQSLRAMS